jgi:hypothetical protein
MMSGLLAPDLTGKIPSKRVQISPYQFPKPRPQPFTNFWRRSHVTIIGGFKGDNFAVLCADSQEVISDYSKQDAEKIKITDYYGNWHTGVASAGDAGFIDLLNYELNRALAKIEDFDYDKVLSIIRATIHRIYKQHIWPDPHAEPPISSLIVLQRTRPSAEVHLLRLDRTIVIPEHQWRFFGLGAHMANYLAKRVYGSFPPGWYTEEQVVNAAIFILKEVKSSISGCAGGTHLVKFLANGGYQSMLTTEAEEVEAKYENFQEAYRRVLMAFSHPDLTDEGFEQQLGEFEAQIRIWRFKRE